MGRAARRRAAGSSLAADDAGESVEGSVPDGAAADLQQLLEA
eukprot:gene54499-40435_t